MEILIQFFFAFFATISFALYFNAPFKSIFPSGLVGGLSWSLYYLVVTDFDNKILGILLAAFLVGILGEYLAIKLKKPATIFITAGIISFVPGAGMYYTMLNIVEKDFTRALEYGTETFFIAATIAIGIMTSTVFSRSIKLFKKN